MKTGPAERRSPRQAGLDLLRFLAASVVICSHASNFGDAGALFNKTPGWFGKFLMSLDVSGWVSVDVFFVLSGFLVSGLLFEEAARSGPHFAPCSLLQEMTQTNRRFYADS